jgi:solute carrier family 25 (mitochondrial adenine nucleotide translocator), member 4/5/6/31
MSGKQEESLLKKFLTECIVGGTAGSISKTVAAPLERVKLLLQIQDTIKSLENNKYTGFGNCLMRVQREEGTLALWRGNWANVVRYFPTTALNFGFKGYFNKMFNKYDPKKNPYWYMFGNVMAGGSAGAACMLFVYPLDFARTRMGVDTGKDIAQR